MRTQDLTEPRANPSVRAALALVAALSASVLISGCNKPVDEQAPPPATPEETAPPAETPPPAEAPTDSTAPAPMDSATPPTEPATPPADPAAAPAPSDSDSAPPKQ